MRVGKPTRRSETSCEWGNPLAGRRPHASGETHSQVGDLMRVPATTEGKDEMERPVALLDADGGGLGLLAELVRRLPAEDYVYLADSARGPYGRAALAEVRRWTEEGAYFLLRFDPKLLVVASYTMGAVAPRTLWAKFPVPAFSPCGLLCQAVAERGARVVAVLASDTTIASGFYQEALAKAGGKAVLCPASALAEAVADGAAESKGPEAPLLLPAGARRGRPTPGRRLAPEPRPKTPGGCPERSETSASAGGRRAGKPEGARRPAVSLKLAALVEEALAPALSAEPRVDAVLLAESGLGVLMPLVRRLLGPKVPVVSALDESVGEVERMLTLARILRPPGATGARYFLASETSLFPRRASALYGAPVEPVVGASPERFFAPMDALRSSGSTGENA
jgi:glutamate racemase